MNAKHKIGCYRYTRLLALEESSDLPFDVDKGFIEQNKKLNHKKTKRGGGPYSQIERDKRRQEVYKLHFDYGYSARKISELMKVNRNTINGDINYWYWKISKNTNIFNPVSLMISNCQRLEIQRSRLREQLDKAGSFQEKLALERLIYEIDSKILHTNNKFLESEIRVNALNIQRLNKWLKDNNSRERYMTLFDKLYVSKKAYEKINKIIEEDRFMISSNSE